MRGFRRKRGADAELDVTTFMNLMVVLVPFLLLSAVFSEITIHDLNLPTLSDAGPSGADNKPKLALEVVIRRDSLDVVDRGSGRIKLIPNSPAGHDFVALSEKLQEVKEAFPNVSAVTLLLEPDVPYNTLIATMDAVRTVPSPASGKSGGPGKPVKRDLFPDVSIGDAPTARKEEGAP